MSFLTLKVVDLPDSIKGASLEAYWEDLKTSQIIWKDDPSVC